MWTYEVVIDLVSWKAKKFIQTYSMQYEVVWRMFSTIDIDYWENWSFIQESLDFIWDDKYGQEEFFRIINEMSNSRRIYFEVKNSSEEIVDFYKQAEKSAEYTKNLMKDILVKWHIDIDPELIVDTAKIIGGSILTLWKISLNPSETMGKFEVMDITLKNFAEQQVELSNLIWLNICTKYYSEYESM